MFYSGRSLRPTSKCLVFRKRTLVAIGTHDLDTIQGPFSYEALEPREINFTPLNQSRPFSGEELMKFYEVFRECEIPRPSFLPC